MIRHIAKVLATTAIALSMLLVADSVQGLAQPNSEIAASAQTNGR